MNPQTLLRPMLSPREEDREFLRFRETRDPQAMARVFDLTASRLLLLAMHLVRDAGQAEDLVQTTFLQAIESADSFQPQGSGSLLAWLMGILTHRARDEQRRQARTRERPAATSLDLDQDQDQDQRPGPLEELQGRDTLEQVRKVLDGLQQPYRHVLVLRLVHGLKAVEIAHSLDQSPETVRTQLRRGLKMVRERLPQSLVVASLFSMLTSEGLAAVKIHVLKAATESVASKTTAVAAGTTWTTVGAIIMKKFHLLGFAAVALMSGIVYLALPNSTACEMPDAPPAQLSAYQEEMPSPVGVGLAGTSESPATTTPTSDALATSHARRRLSTPSVFPRYSLQLPYQAHPAKQKVYETTLSAYLYSSNYIKDKRVRGERITNSELRHLEECVAQIEIALRNDYYEFTPKQERRALPVSTEDTKYFSTEMMGMWLVFKIDKRQYPLAFLGDDEVEARIRKLAQEKRARWRARKGR